MRKRIRRRPGDPVEHCVFRFGAGDRAIFLWAKALQVRLELIAVLFTTCFKRLYNPSVPNMTTKPVTKSTFWSKLWSFLGLFWLAVGLVFGIETATFYITSEPANVKVVEVFSGHHTGKTNHWFAFQAEDQSGRTFKYTANRHKGAKLHKVGETISGRFSSWSGKVYSDAVLLNAKLASAFLIIVGLYLSRSVTFRPIGYFLGRVVGLLMQLFRRVT
jgi:hypothetical protein